MTPKKAIAAAARCTVLNADETQQCSDILKGLIQRRAELKARIFTLASRYTGLMECRTT